MPSSALLKTLGGTDVLMKEAATASDERLDEVEELLDAAITVNEGKGQLFVL